ncbi:MULTISPECIES: C45 family peptidase [unclassified Ensifer]|uniref:C45 family autoproteolytic acyltransferase/hydolase n=1 Tax=unclassified Ensifer TaxID=2633371 RepID=UPI0008136CBC|nr:MULTISPECIES: C45 family peptidase [unclassified Ensifer]OCP18760.1 peptidase C45 [Ensifer sp. LC384]OCP19727.1 peptidase C45 [Ensifer sp. LC54]
MSTDNPLGFVEIAGTPREVGIQLGRFGRDIAHRHLINGHAWASVMAFRGDPRVGAMRGMVEARFPAYWAELQGLAAGLDLPVEDVFLWNCRGDVWAFAPDGCTTVQIPGAEPILAHNEDGDPGFRGHCALAHVRPQGGIAFTSFVYPASVPGHTFAATEAGLVQTVNNIRSRGVGIGLPRMILGRALFDCRTLDDAVHLLETSDRAGAFHMTLGREGDPRLLSVEFTHTSCTVATVDRPQCHANHLIHEGMEGERQVITGSSRSRQQRGDVILAEAVSTSPDPLDILWDKAVSPLPIYRAQPDDPDHENTLATAVFHIGAQSIDWKVYDRAGDAPRFTMNGTLTPH